MIIHRRSRRKSRRKTKKTKGSRKTSLKKANQRWRSLRTKRLTTRSSPGIRAALTRSLRLQARVKKNKTLRAKWKSARSPIAALTKTP